MSNYSIDEDLQEIRAGGHEAHGVPRRISLLLSAIDRGLWIFSLVAAGLILSGMVVVVLAGTVLRWLDVRIVLPHQEMAGYMLAALTFLGLIAGFREGFPRVTVLYDRYPPAIRANMDIILLAAAAAYSGALTYYAWVLVEASRETGTVTSGVLTQPLWVLQTSMAVGLTLFSLYLANSLALRVVRQLIRNPEDG